MKAVLFQRYGPPETLEIGEVKKPKLRKNEVLVKVYASTVTSGVAIIRRADHFATRLITGPFKPWIWKILGIEFSGVIEEIGSKVTKYKIGDKVFGSTGFALGTYAEYVRIKEKKAIALKPESLSWEEAAAIPVGACTANYFLQKKASLQNGQKVLIYGASGSVGTFAVQLAKHYGVEVTGVSSKSNLELVKSIGSDYVIDYADETAANKFSKYDVIFDAVGKASLKAMKQYLKPGGKFITVNNGLAKEKPDTLSFLGSLAEQGQLKPVIDKVFDFEEISEAFRYVDLGHKKGNVAIRIFND